MVELLPVVEQGPDPSLLRATWSSLLLRKALQHDAGQTQVPQLWDWVGRMGLARWPGAAGEALWSALCKGLCLSHPKGRY